METINNKTLEKLKYELVRDGVVSYETLEKADLYKAIKAALLSSTQINASQFIIIDFRWVLNNSI